MRERCTSEIASVQTTFSFKIDNSDAFSCSFLCPDSFKKEKNRFSSEYRGPGNYLRNNFLRCLSQFLVQSD